MIKGKIKYNNSSITELTPEKSNAILCTTEKYCHKNFEVDFECPIYGGNWYHPELSFIALLANSTVYMQYDGTSLDLTMQYSTDAINWNTFTISSSSSIDGTIITLANIGDRVFFRANNKYYTKNLGSSEVTAHFLGTGKLKVSGNIMSLISSNLTQKEFTNENVLVFLALFYSNKAIIDASELLLPATIATTNCYCLMFYDCTNLINCPILPATTLNTLCYGFMFMQCSSLVTIPSLPATNLGQGCYRSMFLDCIGLITIPDNLLPATNLETYCYCGMFEGCTSLTTLLNLPALTLVNNCYEEMFKGCTNIKLSSYKVNNYLIPYCIPTSGTGTSGTNSLKYMFTSTGGTFAATPNINTTYYLWDYNL